MTTLAIDVDYFFLVRYFLLTREEIKERLPFALKLPFAFRVLNNANIDSFPIRTASSFIGGKSYFYGNQRVIILPVSHFVSK